jgi:hypothetical protein
MIAKFSIIDFNVNDKDLRWKFNRFMETGDYDEFRRDSDAETRVKLAHLVNNLEWNE